MENLSNFMGRDRELAELEAMYKQQGYNFVPVYGRRRVGKSELILKFISNKPNLYFLGKKAPPSDQIREFLQTAAEALHEPLLASLLVPDWKAALKAAVQKIPSSKKFVLVLDEFQWTAESSPELPSVLQELLDLDWKRAGNIFLIVCGSCMGFMEREVLGEKSPLFGRRTGQIFLKPFSYLEAAGFFPKKSLADKTACYFICGGIPYYLRFFSNANSVFQNIQQHILNEFGALFYEPDFLLREELRDLSRYYGILTALASGSVRTQAIAEATGIESKKLFYYLDQLIALGYVTRRFPLCRGRGVARDVRYVLADPFLRFWFHFLYPHTSFVAQMKARESFIQLVRPHLSSYFGTCFEILCREALGFLYQREGVSVPFEIGEYWDRDVQIDVLGYRSKDCVDVGECRWGAVPSVPLLIKEIQNKVPKYPNPHNLSVQCRIFTQRTKPPRLDKAIKWHSLKELYELGD